jgi:hypothetical protein
MLLYFLGGTFTGNKMSLKPEAIVKASYQANEVAEIGFIATTLTG